ncbi:MAG: hypothetical protein KJP16_04030 [Gammaproteobacteria bacterium]|nr:hypothetical protein [Gammaproteobacteria bacterium]NNL49964.1 hypothetical protein [Woeseiaceae bacterium]
MYIPKKWVRASGTGRLPDGRQFPTSAWGWGDDDRTASSKAKKRLQNLLDRLRRGEPFPEKYTYDDRPVREEILEVIGANADKADAVVTRNRHGVQVLNTARLLFLDIDFPPSSGIQRLLAKIGLGRDRSEESVLTRLRETLQQYSRATFRIYRTAAGLRVMAIDRDFKPTGSEAAELMKTTNTDPLFIKLCAVQDSFRARLTPKPWRCNSSSPPVEYPRGNDASRRQFESWLGDYEKACDGYATCSYLETVGNGRPAGFARASIELHDRMTRCNDSLPLA